MINGATPWFALPPVRSTHQLTTYDRSRRHKVITVAPGERAVIGTAEGPGYLAKLWLTFPGWFHAHWEPERPVDPAMIKNVAVQITVDGADQPQVSAPVADLCGVGLCRPANFASAHLGMSSGGFFFNLPMPYRERAEVAVINLGEEHPTDVFCNVTYQQTEQPTEALPYLHALYSSGRQDGSQPLTIADVQGSGRYVGCTLSGQGEPRNYLSFLEAPEHFRIDDDWDEPRIVGTGLEDYFLGGWYFRDGPVTGPDHGVVSKDPLDSAVAMYRVHTYDAIAFDRRLRATFETPWDAERLRPFAHSSVAFCYLDEPTAAPPLPTGTDVRCWYRWHALDHQSFP